MAGCAPPGPSMLIRVRGAGLKLVAEGDGHAQHIVYRDALGLDDHSVATLLRAATGEPGLDEIGPALVHRTRHLRSRIRVPWPSKRERAEADPPARVRESPPGPMALQGSP